MKTSLRFLGAAKTVTGSRHLLKIGRMSTLVDCGLFQGLKRIRQQNWEPFPVAPATIDAVVLTHAHIDHSGYLPLLVRDGFAGPVYSTPGTEALCQVLLPDSGFLHEKDAERANRYGYTRHKPALPLYTKEDAERCLASFQSRPFHRKFEVARDVQVTFRHSGHILGAATVEFNATGRRIVFSGDLGQFNSATMPDPEPIAETDVLVIESTYGGRQHDPRDPEEELAEVIVSTALRGGTILIPAFAVGRAQTLLFHIARLKRAHRIPDLPVFLDSPMAINASEIYCRNLSDHRLSENECRMACDVATYTRTADESRALNALDGAKIIISASGMATGGRVLHHLKRYLPDPRSTILFAGFQAQGTRGAAILQGAEQVKIHGEFHRVRATAKNLSMLSAHADQSDLLRWLSNFRKPPSRIFIVHGEPDAAESLQTAIKENLGWKGEIPDQFDEVVL